MEDYCCVVFSVVVFDEDAFVVRDFGVVVLLVEVFVEAFGCVGVEVEVAVYEFEDVFLFCVLVEEFFDVGSEFLDFDCEVVAEGEHF